MRIGVVVAQASATNGGGFTFEQEVLHALEEVAGKTAHELVILAPETIVRSVTAAVAGSGLPVHAVPAREGRIVRTLMREVEFVRAHWHRPSDIDRVATTLGVDFVWFLSAAPDRTELPYMTVVWDLQHRATPWFPELSAGGTWDGRESYHRWFLQRATRIITGTKVGRDQLVQFYQILPENILILPHPTPRFTSNLGDETAVLQKFCLPENFILYPAQFWPHKNHANLVLALDVLVKRGRKFCLALTGADKGNRSHIEALCDRLGLGDSVRFLGFVEQADLVTLYRKAAALAYVSWCGPENLPPLEAFANGCPVVVTRIPGSEEQLGGAAEFCDPADPDDIARAILNVVDDEALRARLVAAGKQRAERFMPFDYVVGAMKFFDEFEAVRRCWP